MEFQSGYVSVEGDDLYYKVRGEGVPILFIAPGGGDGDNYLPVADILAYSYKVITYDRRANSRSTRHFPEEFSIAQQTRDAIAVLNIVGEEKAFVVGNSSGAVIALDLITKYPNSVRAAVIHEAPIPSVIKEAEMWKRFFESCKSLGSRFGSSIGATKFMFGIQMPVMGLIKASSAGKKYAENEKSSGDVNRMSSKESSDVLIKNELLPVTSYVPEFNTLEKFKSKIFIACGDYGLKKNTWYAETSRVLSQRIDCELVAFPGHHGSFMDMPAEWTNTLLRILKRFD
jgi:pimeloyl-ACP methyl ester carboxylesterase